MTDTANLWKRLEALTAKLPSGRDDRSNRIRARVLAELDQLQADINALKTL
jgi:hypothetical protein